MPRLDDWANGNPYKLNRKKTPRRDVKHTGLYFQNQEGAVKLIIANVSTGEVIEAPDDMTVFVMINAEAAEHVRDDLLNPAEFPECV